MRLAREIMKYPESVDQAAEDLAPHRICKQLHRLSQAFAAFYENCPVLVEDDNTRNERLALCRITGGILNHGLNLLGIDAPDRM